MDKKDFLLLAVSAADGKPVTPVQLQKSLFLMGKAGLPEVPTPFYSFEAYHYGPFSVEIYEDTERLRQEGLVIRTPATDGQWKETTISTQGQLKAHTLAKELSAGTKEFIQAVVQWVQSLSFNDLVRTIYKVYPEFRQNSVFQG